MKIFVTGAGGFLGSKICDYLSKLDCEICPIGFDSSNVVEGDFVLHLAAISSPDRCENEYQLAYEVNVEQTIEFIENCLKKGAKVIFFSSDMVYGSSDDGEVFDENSMCRPLGKYAEMKYEAEQKFAEDSGFKVVRLSYVFGEDDKFSKYLEGCAEKGEEAEVYGLLKRNVVDLADVLEGIKALIHDFDGLDFRIVNFCGARLLSRAELAEGYKRAKRGDLRIKVVDPGEDFFNSRAKKIEVKSLYFSKLINKGDE